MSSSKDRGVRRSGKADDKNAPWPESSVIRVGFGRKPVTDACRPLPGRQDSVPGRRGSIIFSRANYEGGIAPDKVVGHEGVGTASKVARIYD